MSFVNVDGLDLFYEQKGTGPPLLMIHGLGGDNRGWEFQEEELAERFTLLMPELRGHGRSEGPAASTVPADRFAADLAIFLNELEYKKVHVIGHSMGGIIAQQFALDFPERVRKLVLMSTTPKVTEATIEEVYSWREAEVEGGREAYHWAAIQSSFSEEYIKNNREIIDYIMSKEDMMNEQGVLAAGMGLTSFDITDRLSEIEAETLVIHGEADCVMDFSLGKLLQRNIHNSELVSFPNCGHSPTVEKRETLGQILIDFLG